MKKILLPLIVLILLLVSCETEPQQDNAYTITYETNGGSEIASIEIDIEGEVIEPITPLKVDYIFKGWYSDIGLTTPYNFPSVAYSDITLYAKWELVQDEVPEPVVKYTINYSTNGGNPLNSTVVESGNIITEPVDPLRENFKFKGWYYDSKLKHPFSFTTIPTNNMTLYAKWDYDVNISADSDIVLENLPYSNYFDITNPVITIIVKGIGEMKLELFPSVAPNTVNNFIMYIEKGDFTNNSFHRVIEDFMIQGGNTYSTTCPINGDFENNGFTNELSHSRGVLSMARTNIMNSATSQFFIVHKDSTFLDPNYATFGGLIEGFDVLDFIAGVNTNMYDGPIDPITIENITVELNGYIPENPICGN